MAHNIEICVDITLVLHVEEARSKRARLDRFPCSEILLLSEGGLLECVLRAFRETHQSSEYLLSLAMELNAVIQQHSLPNGRPWLRHALTREIKRRKRLSVWWFQQNWEILGPLVEHIESNSRMGLLYEFSTMD
jgi:hypothetical protein